MSLALDPQRISAHLRRIHPVTPDAAEALAVWTRTLAKWSRAQRLVGWRTGADLLDKGLADCWIDVALLQEAALSGPIVDVGSGSGLPGLILAAAFPDRPIHLVESRRKRVAFMREAARAMGRPHVQVHHGRSDAIRGTLALDAPIFVSRAFASPGDALAEAERWDAQAAIVASSIDKVEAEESWPPNGWRQGHGNSRQTRGASRHDLLLRVR